MDSLLSEKYPVVSNRICDHFGCTDEELCVKKEYTGGYSGDTVLLINVSGTRDPSSIGDYVLKIGTAEEEHLVQEIDNTMLAAQKTGVGRILIPALRNFSRKDPTYYLYDVAGNDLIGSTSLSHLTDRKKFDRLRDISEQLLSAWSKDIDSSGLSIRDILLKWIGESRVAYDSRLCQRIKKLVVDELTPYFRYGKEIIPNPLFYICNSDSSLSKGRAFLNNALLSQTHGDLNANNIIIQPEQLSKGYKFYFIDFEQYCNKAPIFFDHAYLLLNTLFDEAISTGLMDWYKQVQQFFDSIYDGQRIKNDISIHSYIDSIQHPIDTFIVHQQMHNRISVKLQWLAANVAAGINFVNKRNRSDTQQAIAFLYSSAACKTLLRAIGQEIPSILDVPSLQVGQTPGMAEVWKKLDGFSSDNRYILISSCLESSYSVDDLSNLSPIHWCSIIEINHLSENPMRTSVLPRFKMRQGYRFVSLIQQQEMKSIDNAPTWFYIYVPETQSNKGIYYNKNVHEKFMCAALSPLLMREKEPIIIVLDPTNIDAQLFNKTIEDIVVLAGENTPIHIVCLGPGEVKIESDDMISISVVGCSLKDISRNVHALLEDRIEKDEICLPCKDGIKRISQVMAANFTSDMTLVHRNITRNISDDDDQGFFLGNEATWHDIASQRDVIRLDYINSWREKIRMKLENITSGSNVIVDLRHLAGGGGTTLSKRIAWDLCTTFPTVMLNCISDQTSERLKAIYDECAKPILVVAEVSDGRITADGISKLRREMLPKGMRAMFLCVSRVNNSPQNHSEGVFYLANTPDMSMSQEEAEMMFHCFRGKLDDSIREESERISDLSSLTYSSEKRSLRHPFFYGLFTYGKNYKGLSNFVSHQYSTRNSNEKRAINMLALVTSYSQSVNLTCSDISLFLYADGLPESRRLDVQEWLLNNSLISRRGKSFRINHPIVADEILRQGGYNNETNMSRMVGLVIDFIDTVSLFYGPKSERLNEILHELFTHRDIIDEEESMKFSKLVTVLGTRDRAVAVISHIRDVVVHNPHYSNHLARLFLYSILPKQSGVYPDVENALKYATEAIERAEESDTEGLGIHYHLLGKVYTQSCVESIKRILKKENSISNALKGSRVEFCNSNTAFDACISHGQSGYGITGKLELIAKVLDTLKTHSHLTVSKIITSERMDVSLISNMIAEAGDLIIKYIDIYGVANSVFQRACIKFYKTIGDFERIETILNANATTSKLRIESRRALSTLIIQNSFGEKGSFSYDRLSQSDLMQIFKYMESNFNKDYVESREDRIRWLETFRRLDIFSLKTAYTFLLEWPESNNDIYVCYYRYIVAFMIYVRTGIIPYKEVKLHLQQCEILSRNVYGKNVNTTLDYAGNVDSGIDNTAIVHIAYQEFSDNKDEREEANKEFRRKHCTRFTGIIQGVHERMVTVSFMVEKDPLRTFNAKVPVTDLANIFTEGELFSFYVGFSYSGFRAWDMVPLHQVYE